MDWILGSFTFSTAPGRHPDTKTALTFDGGEKIVSLFNPVGYTGTIATFLGRKGEAHTLHIPLATAADKNSLKTIYESQAIQAFTDPVGAHGNVLVVGFIARATIMSRYDITLELVAQ